MEFFGMGPLEILLILIVGVIAFGPGRLPRMARNLGKGITAFKKATMDLTTQVSKEFEELEKEDADLTEEETKRAAEKASSPEVQATDDSDTAEEHASGDGSR
jgi:TatA/E family protein of Tat protein translocase